MTSDARISVGLPGHPKTKKLIRRLGQAAGWNFVCLILWAVANRSDGDLSGLSDEDIELSAEWDGAPGAFVSELVAVRFLDGQPGGYNLHDWDEHNPWAAGAEMRSAKARWNAAKRHHGVAAADRLVPEYAATRTATSNADSNPDSTANSNAEPESSNAPYPSPSPSPLPNQDTPHTPQGGKRQRKSATAGIESLPGFAVFYAAYPRKVGKEAALKAWIKLAPDEALQATILGALAAQKPHLDAREKGRFIPHASTWLNNARWEDEIPGGRKAAPVAADGRVWWQVAGFEAMEQAQNERCHLGNYHEFRNGNRITQGAPA